MYFRPEWECSAEAAGPGGGDWTRKTRRKPSISLHLWPRQTGGSVFYDMVPSWKQVSWITNSPPRTSRMARVCCTSSRIDIKNKCISGVIIGLSDYYPKVCWKWYIETRVRVYKDWMRRPYYTVVFNRGRFPVPSGSKALNEDVQVEIYWTISAGTLLFRFPLLIWR